MHLTTKSYVLSLISKRPVIIQQSLMRSVHLRTVVEFITSVQHHPQPVRRPTTYLIARPVDSARACVSLRYVD